MVDSKKRPGKDLDRIDRNILNELQKDGRISNVELSKRVGLSPTPCLERVRRLERQGFIQGYTALLNPHYLDASLLVFVEITLNRGAPDVFEQFNTAVQKLEEIQECHLVSGDFDYLLKTRVPDMSAYRKLLGETLLRLPGVISPATNTLIILPFRYASLAFWRSSLPPVVWRQSTLTISGILPPVASLAAY